jgi:hypothetical protein
LLNSTSLSLYLTTAIYLLAAYVHVSFRTQHPEKETLKDVMKELQKNNIDFTQLVEWKTDHCLPPESSTEEGSSD